MLLFYVFQILIALTSHFQNLLLLCAEFIFRRHAMFSMLRLSRNPKYQSAYTDLVNLQICNINIQLLEIKENFSGTEIRI